LVKDGSSKFKGSGSMKESKETTFSDPFYVPGSHDDTSNIRLHYEGNVELKRRFDLQNDQLIRTVMMEFLSDSLNQRHSLIESPQEDENPGSARKAEEPDKIGSGCQIC
jgi:hypothetical protein